MEIDWHYPFLWGLDLHSYYKSLWLGWWLVTWRWERWMGLRVEDLRLSFQPGT